MGAEQSAEAPAAEDAAATAQSDVASAPSTSPAETTPSAPPAPLAPKAASLTAAEIGELNAADTTNALNELTNWASTSTDADVSTLLEQVCTRVRVLCRDEAECNKCSEAGAAVAVVGAMSAAAQDTAVQLAGLSALVNLCSGATDNTRRALSVDAGAVPAIVTAMTTHATVKDVQHMGCMAIQNICFGEDPPALARRKLSVDSGGVQAVLAAMNSFESLRGAKEVGVITLQLMTYRMPELRQLAIEAGAKAEWLKDSGSTSGSSRRWLFGTFGTSRKNDFLKRSVTSPPRT
uniref:Armadillo repeat-containing domain-containing protein n=1 Tax=Haptolina brevifila TaxID=156173 RepID=A0A7S2I7A0_9EUKA|mmetsp:Transcript_62709/g.123851  ORF Transcript_62709/g.123851 Transcript_62709/m.123851 type:complete len:292 (+) Transcript_62709:18-893(+)|eukprot:CAMPEP_0174704140 /NCGR_PEP_ID=MMETSP1094-20130205/7840_1 /TAXON_ID=156173 /ORGANISM="Chrysochromulina brevifilum, Strain UTEX LB 985" /LENGTH=291 /DNA_ID=CAMNT_0015902163 /DNA_START=18 /DNA_END=893 /DNA_ORIENTATION=+